MSYLIFRSLNWSLNHFLIFVYGMRESSNVVVLHGAVQLFQHHLLKTLSSPLYISVSFIID